MLFGFACQFEKKYGKAMKHPVCDLFMRRAVNSKLPCRVLNGAAQG